MSADLIRQKARERHFLEQLLDGKKLENYKIPVPIKAELRKYQQVHLFFYKLVFKWSTAPKTGIVQVLASVCSFGLACELSEGSGHRQICLSRESKCGQNFSVCGCYDYSWQ